MSYSLQMTQEFPEETFLAFFIVSGEEVACIITPEALFTQEKMKYLDFQQHFEYNQGIACWIQRELNQPKANLLVLSRSKRS